MTVQSSELDTEDWFIEGLIERTKKPRGKLITPANLLLWEQYLSSSAIDQYCCKDIVLTYSWGSTSTWDQRNLIIGIKLIITIIFWVLIKLFANSQSTIIRTSIESSSSLKFLWYHQSKHSKTLLLVSESSHAQQRCRRKVEATTREWTRANEMRCKPLTPSNYYLWNWGHKKECSQPIYGNIKCNVTWHNHTPFVSTILVVWYSSTSWMYDAHNKEKDRFVGIIIQ
jgi:hypothetical protein